MKKLLLIIFLLSVKTLFAQQPVKHTETEHKPPLFNITNYLGIAPSESEVTFYVGATAKLSKSIAVGLKGGVYNYGIDINEGLTAAYDPVYYETNANVGIYNVADLPFNVQNLTYIGALTGEYFYKNNLSFEFSAGIKYYLQKTYLANIEWAVPYPNAPPPKIKVTPDYDIKLNESKEIIKAYYFIGVNYTINYFNIGVFGDNVYSVGVNAGVSF